MCTGEEFGRNRTQCEGVKAFNMSEKGKKVQSIHSGFYLIVLCGNSVTVK